MREVCALGLKRLLQKVSERVHVVLIVMSLHSLLVPGASHIPLSGLDFLLSLLGLLLQRLLHALVRKGVVGVQVGLQTIVQTLRHASSLAAQFKQGNIVALTSTRVEVRAEV